MFEVYPISHEKENKTESFAHAWKRDYHSFAFSGTKTSSDQIMKALGVLGWSVCYVAIGFAHFQTDISLIPYQLLSYNIVWEIGRVFVWNKGDEGWLTWFMGFAWLAMESFLFYKFWEAGGGTKLSLQEEQIRFVAYFTVYGIIGYVTTKTGESASRIWRHLSYYWGMMFQINLMILQQQMTIPYLVWMLWGTGLGNFAYIGSVRKGYDGWENPRKYPIRFLIFVFQFIPVFVVSLYGMYICLV